MAIDTGQARFEGKQQAHKKASIVKPFNRSSFPFLRAVARRAGENDSSFLQAAAGGTRTCCTAPLRQSGRRLSCSRWQKLRRQLPRSRPPGRCPGPGPATPFVPWAKAAVARWPLVWRTGSCAPHVPQGPELTDLLLCPRP